MVDPAAWGRALLACAALSSSSPTTIPPRAEEEALAAGAVRALAAIPRRGSATAGEHSAAAWIAEQLCELGLEARVELENAHGTHWWPYGLPSGMAAAAGLLHLRHRGRVTRTLASVLGLVGSAAVIDDIEGSARWLRRALPRHQAANVIAEAGDPGAASTVVVHAHHDAAHSGLMFHPRVARPDDPIPTLALVVAAPGLVAAAALSGRRRLLRGTVALAATVAALFADSGARAPVPGANDDASGVAALLLLARRLRREPPRRVRVILLSTGCEEAMLEGMDGFMRRHRDGLDTRRTAFISVDSLGWELLATRRGEGALHERRASAGLIGLLTEAARAAGIELRQGLRFWIPTDGFIPLRQGYPEANLCSVQPDGSYPNYHRPSDTPERVHVPTILAGAAVLEKTIRSLDASESWPL